jgi:WD40 repeat protein
LNAIKEFVKKTELRGHGGAVYALEQGVVDGKFFSGSSDCYITEWDIKTGISKAFAQLPAIVYSLCYVPNCAWLIAGNANGGLHIIDVIKNTQIKYYQTHKSGVFDIKFSVINNAFYSVSGDGLLSAWSLDDPSLIKSIKLSDLKLRAIAINIHETEMAVACGDGSIKIISLPDLTIKKTIAAHTHSVYALQYHPNLPYLLSGGRDAHLNVWNTEDFTLTKSIPAHNYAIYSIVFNKDNSLFATASRDKTIKIWDANTIEFLQRIDKEKQGGHGHSVNKLYWDFNSDTLISASDDKNIMLWSN